MNKYALYGFATLFTIGILLLLATGDADLHDVLGMTLSGAIIAIFGGIGFLCELYINKGNKNE